MINRSSIIQVSDLDITSISVAAELDKLVNVILHGAVSKICINYAIMSNNIFVNYRNIMLNIDYVDVPFNVFKESQLSDINFLCEKYVDEMLNKFIIFQKGHTSKINFGSHIFHNNNVFISSTFYKS